MLLVVLRHRQGERPAAPVDREIALEPRDDAARRRVDAVDVAGEGAVGVRGVVADEVGRRAADREPPHVCGRNAPLDVEVEAGELVVPRLMLIWLSEVICPGMPAAMSAGVCGARVMRLAYCAVSLRMTAGLTPLTIVFSRRTLK
jgi:hypothetical protein